MLSLRPDSEQVTVSPSTQDQWPQYRPPLYSVSNLFPVSGFYPSEASSTSYLREEASRFGQLFRASSGERHDEYMEQERHAGDGIVALGPAVFYGAGRPGTE